MNFQSLLHLALLHRPLAYLDPGSGSLIVQLVLAVVLGVGVLIKVFWKKIKGLFVRPGSKKEDDSQLQP